MISELEADYDIAPLCRLLGVSRGGYYAWRDRPQSARAKNNQKLLTALHRIHHQVNGIYGSPRMTVALRRQGYTCCENTVAKIMQLNGLRAKMDRRFKPRAWAPSSLIRKKNLLEDHAGPRGRNEIWVADFTYTRINGRFVYLATVMDLYTRKILGTSISQERDSLMTLNAIKKARQSAAGHMPDIFHTDRGIEYANYRVHNYLKEHGVKQSMSGKGNCYDNAHAESFFHTYKSEFYYHEEFKDIIDFKQKTNRYIRFYNEKRLHSSLGYQSPVEFDMHGI